MHVCVHFPRTRCKRSLGPTFNHFSSKLKDPEGQSNHGCFCFRRAKQGYCSSKPQARDSFRFCGAMETNTDTMMLKHVKLFMCCTSDRWTRTSKTLDFASFKVASIFHLRLKTQPQVAASLPPRGSPSHSRTLSELPTHWVETQTTAGGLSGKWRWDAEGGWMILSL